MPSEKVVLQSFLAAFLFVVNALPVEAKGHLVIMEMDAFVEEGKAKAPGDVLSAISDSTMIALMRTPNPGHR